MKRNLVITYKQDVLHMVEHNGSHTFMGSKDSSQRIYNYDKVMTSRSERESFRNIKTKSAAERLVNRRNKKEIIVAKWNSETIYPVILK